MTKEALPECVLPGCRNVTDQAGTPCSDCRTAFGDMLREGDPIPAAVIEHRDTATRAAIKAQQLLAGQPGDRKRNQICWICEERHTCTRAANGWECDTCLEIR